MCIRDRLDAGVTSFKIEGRLKDLAYIRNVVAHYRRAVDEALALRPGLVRSSVGESVPDFTPDPSKSFTRGESDYFLDGKRAGVADVYKRQAKSPAGIVSRAEHSENVLLKAVAPVSPSKIPAGTLFSAVAPAKRRSHLAEAVLFPKRRPTDSRAVQFSRALE